jgi:hypothetical protein
MKPRPPQTANVHTRRRQPARRSDLTVAAKPNATVVVDALGVTSEWTLSHQLGAGGFTCSIIVVVMLWARPASTWPEATINEQLNNPRNRLVHAECQFRWRLVPDFEFKPVPLMVRISAGRNAEPPP